MSTIVEEFYGKKGITPETLKMFEEIIYSDEWSGEGVKRNVVCHKYPNGSIHYALLDRKEESGRTSWRWSGGSTFLKLRDRGTINLIFEGESDALMAVQTLKGETDFNIVVFPSIQFFTPERLKGFSPDTTILCFDNIEVDTASKKQAVKLDGSGYKRFNFGALKVKDIREGCLKSDNALDFLLKGINDALLIENEAETVNFADQKVTQVTEVTEVTEDFYEKELDRKLIERVGFPLDTFPPFLRSMISGYAKALQVSEEQIAFYMLIIISGCVGNTLRVRPKRGWEVPLFLWGAYVKTSGRGGSHPMRELMKPVHEMQHKAYVEHQRKLTQKKEEKFKGIPVLEHFYVQDTTVPALISCLKDSVRGCISHQDELSSLINGFNQFSKNKGNEKQFYLSLFDCGAIKVDRKCQEPIIIKSSGISIIGGIQPEAFTETFKQDSIDDGMVPRFIFLLCNNAPQRFTTDELSYKTKRDWNELIEYLYNIPLEIVNEMPEYKHLNLDEDATHLFGEFYDSYMRKQRFLSKNASLFIPKLITYCLKLCGLFHVLHQYEYKVKAEDVDNLISRYNLEKAVKLTDFFLSQVFEILQLYDHTERLSNIERELLMTLDSLRGEVHNGRLLFSLIVKSLNERLPDNLEHTSRRVSTILTGKRFRLKTCKGTQNHSFLLWDEERIAHLLLENRVTTVTSVTNSEQEEDSECESKVTTVTPVTDSEQKEDSECSKGETSIATVESSVREDLLSLQTATKESNLIDLEKQKEWEEAGI